MLSQASQVVPASDPRSMSYSSAPTFSSSSSRVIMFEDGWSRISRDGISKLEAMISSGLTNNIHFSNAEYAPLYTLIYSMCIQKDPYCWTADLYNGYEKSLAEYLQNVSLNALSKVNGTRLLTEWVRRWNDHLLMKRWLVALFLYLDRFYVKRTRVKTLNECAMHKYKTIVFDASKQRVTSAILDCIERERNGESIDRSLIQQSLSIYIEMSSNNTQSKDGFTKVYQLDFERYFLHSTREYYTKLANEWRITDSLGEYLRKCEQRVIHEQSRIDAYLHSTTTQPLLEALHQTLLLTHQSSLLEKEGTGVKAMLEENRTEDLTRLYQLYSAIPSSLPAIARIVQIYITTCGSTLIEQQSTLSDQSTFISELMILHELNLELIKICFHNHSIFQRALREAFEQILNKNNFIQTTAELLATHADNVLKKGGIKQTEKQLMQTLDGIVRLFTYLIDKDLFSEFYRKQLATRLLMQRSASTDAEKNMIGKLKLRCGAQFTSKLEGMINDMRNAIENTEEFNKFLKFRNININNIDFTVQTLTTGSWPTYPIDILTVPPIMNTCMDAFRVFYDSKTNNRKLQWIHELGTVTLAAHYPKRRVDLIVSTVQAVILLLFNESDDLTIDQITTMTGLTAEVIKQQLKSLINAKFKLLTKLPADGYATSHIIRVNLSFVQPMRSIRIPNALRKTTSKDRASASSSVNEDRKHAIEACIVRIMKSRKTLTHQQLMIDVINQLQAFFQPDPKQIKQRIEDLIHREYLERDKEQSNVYHYLA